MQGVKGMMWQKASCARFASSLAACFVLSARVDDKSLYKHIVDKFFEKYPSLVETSKTKKIILDTFKANGTKVERLGMIFSSVVYPVVRRLGEAAKDTSVDTHIRPVSWLTSSRTSFVQLLLICAG